MIYIYEPLLIELGVEIVELDGDVVRVAADVVIHVVDSKLDEDFLFGDYFSALT